MTTAKVFALLLAAALALSLAACGDTTTPPDSAPEPSSSLASTPPASMPPSSQSSVPPQNDDSEIPSLTTMVEGESVLLVDMADPLVQGFFSGCDGYDVDSLTITVSSMETKQEIPGHIDPRYTFPMFYLNTDGTYEDYLALMEKISNGEKLAGYIIAGDPAPKWGGILFDETDFPISVGNWAEGFTVSHSSVTEELLHYEKADRVQAFRDYFKRHIPIDTDELRGELASRDFDIEKTTIKAGAFGYPGFFITDGEHELIFVTDGIMNGSYQFGAYITPQELAADQLAAVIQSESANEWVKEMMAEYGISDRSAYQSAVFDLGYQINELLDDKTYCGTSIIDVDHFVTGIKVYYFDYDAVKQTVDSLLAEFDNTLGKVDIVYEMREYSLSDLHEIVAEIENELAKNLDLSNAVENFDILVVEDMIAIYIQHGKSEMDEYLKSASFSDYVNVVEMSEPAPLA
jgi:hypothetical protein